MGQDTLPCTCCDKVELLIPGSYLIENPECTENVVCTASYTEFEMDSYDS